jgi:cysteine sulfinate desulfinase/cysteine desulfurase-like protein
MKEQPGHERGLRPGTDVASIVGLRVACERARVDLDAESERARAILSRDAT